MTIDLTRIREEYTNLEHDISTTSESPFSQFEAWFEQAMKAEIREPNAMVLATVDENGRPSQRTVLLKVFDERGFVFFTNYGSRKASQMKGNENVSLLFPWYELHRQVEIDGTVEKISTLESLKYFAVRPRGSQIGAWVSRQSEVVSSRSILESKWRELEAKFMGGEVPLPDFWGGYRVKPSRLEFWQGGAKRLHDRIEYIPNDNAWLRRRLSP